jgi:hypothetical protein
LFDVRRDSRPVRVALNGGEHPLRVASKSGDVSCLQPQPMSIIELGERVQGATEGRQELVAQLRVGRQSVKGVQGRAQVAGRLLEGDALESMVTGGDRGPGDRGVVSDLSARRVVVGDLAEP